jgi:hypothetical protein
MHLESIAAFGAHARELSVHFDAWSSCSLTGDSPTPTGRLDAVAAAEGAVELSGATVADASGGARKWTSAATAKYVAM